MRFYEFLHDFMQVVETKQGLNVQGSLDMHNLFTNYEYCLQINTA
jgi:hypothetical protein